MAVYELRVDHFLSFIEPETTSNLKGCSVTDFLSLSDSARTQYIDKKIVQLFNVGHIVEVRRSVANLTVSHYLDLHQRAGRTFYLTVESNFYPYQFTRTIEYEIVEQSLLLTQEIEVLYSKVVSSTIEFTQDIVVNCVRYRTVIDTLEINSNQNKWIADKYSYSINLPTLSGPNAPEC